MKHCYRCGLDLPAAAFYKDSRRKDGLQARCKSCDTALAGERSKNRTPEQRQVNATRSAAWYEANRQSHIANIIARRKKDESPAT